MDAYEDRLRRMAYRLWEEEGQPEGREDAHWEMARELVAAEDDRMVTTGPISETARSGEFVDPIEPGKPTQNAGTLPEGTDHGGEQSYPTPSPRAARAGSDCTTASHDAGIDVLIRPLAAFAINLLKLAVVKRIQTYVGGRQSPPRT